MTDITPWRAWLVAPVAALLAAPAAAQTLGSSLDALVTEQIDAQVEEQFVQSLEDAVAEQVESDVASSIEQGIESSVSDAIEQQIESDVATSVEQAVESNVEETIEQTIESDVTESIEHTVESGVTETIEQTIESDVAATIEQWIEPGVAAALEQTLDDALAEALGEDLEDPLDGASAGAGLEGSSGQPDDGSSTGSQAAAAAFVPGIDAEGRTVEGDVWVVLVPTEHVARIEGWGFTVRERRGLEALERVMLRVDAPEDRGIAEAALELALDAPGTLVDFNHVYRSGTDTPATLDGRPVRSPTAQRKAQDARCAVGIVDSAVATDHEALRSAAIVHKDLVPFTGERPAEHGTAVASILVGKSRELRSQLPGGRLYAASAFFFDDTGEAAATTASLVAALGWLAEEGVCVVNMSLAGPANRVLEAAIAAAVERGQVVVAAVGNDGPAGEPLYPAAYESVIGVTAVDSRHRVYRYANRGRQVTFAAPGVKIRVARANGGYGTETGTSMAAPYASAIIARSMTARADELTEKVLSSLKAAAIDLGEADFDDVYGFGLIAAIE